MKKTVNEWMLNNNDFDNAIFTDASGKERYIFLDAEKMYESHVLSAEKIDDFTCKLYTDYEE